LVNREVLLSLSKDDLVVLALSARVAALEGLLAAPGKTPDNSSLPPSKGQKSNLPAHPKKGRHGRPGVARALAEHPDRVVVATLPACPHCHHPLGAAASAFSSAG
jgi:transposase